jgi:acetyl-CoA C-acetyltransferase
MGKRKVAITGVGYNDRFVSKRPDVNIVELVSKSVVNCLANSGYDYKDIDAIVMGNMHTFEGVNQPQLWAGDHIGGVMKPVIRIATGGTTGMSVFQCGYYHVASGMYDTVMVIGWEKHDEGNAQVGLTGILLPEAFGMFQFGPDLAGGRGGMMSGGGSAGAASYQAMSYLSDTPGATPEHIDRIAAQARGNAAKNPFAHLQVKDCTEEEIQKTPMIGYPLRFGHMCPTSCGSLAMILTTGEKAKKKKDKAWVNAVATGTSDATVGNVFEGMITDPATQAMAIEISKKCYKKAGIKDPKKDFQVAEVYDGFAHQELMWPQRLGLVENSCKALDEGKLKIDGEMPINPSGGVVSTNAIGASAMVRVSEAALQIMGKAGGHQVPRKVKNALAHGWGGLFQFVTLTILGDEPRG